MYIHKIRCAPVVLRLKKKKTKQKKIPPVRFYFYFSAVIAVGILPNLINIISNNKSLHNSSAMTKTAKAAKLPPPPNKKFAGTIDRSYTYGN